MHEDAVSVLKQVLKKAKGGDLEYEKIVVKELLGPYLKAEAAKSGDGGTKSTRPVVNINISKADGVKPVRVIDSD